ncbi:right-handed parallel beta-helix repeat-containing protein [Haloarcula salinisoli]|uniref:Right-handed parallel beta-helix repeat-containing protein n=1 Tax=Haloarcula salinisoli TaxID=2487746 RepID=A0A8J8C9R4_9EURY|nr:right-handed parallel beta-helix repeat-containing protein [Halomicroarcula salinisoli]MBX0305876.1 right-handed parallel beta-helix repeat-containing protein [Halomicroarcula salinisoli]
MSDEQRSDRGGKLADLATGNRRQFLKYAGAGTLGCVTILGLDTILDDTRQSDGTLPEQLIGSTETADVVVQEREQGYEGIETNGDTIDSGADGWTVLENSIDAVPDGGSIVVSGRYQSESVIDVSKSINMYGPEALIEQQQPGDFALRFHGAERHQTALTEAASSGDTVLPLADISGVQQGDIVLLKDVGAEPILGRGHVPSEPHSVIGVDGDTVTLADSIVWRDGYDQDTLVYVLDPVEIHVSGLEMRAPAKDESYYGVAAQICRDSSIENLHMEKFGSRAIRLGPSANSRVRDCTVLQSADIEAADGYGIQVWSGSHDIVVEGCTAKECRHPLSVTAGGDLQVASRAITFRDCFVTGNGAGALNCHGGSAHDVRFEDCTVHTVGDPGLTTGAQETNVAGCEFRMDGHNAVDTRDDTQEAVITVTDTDVYGAKNGVKLSREENLNFAPLWKFVHIENVRAYGCTHLFTLGGGRVDRVRDLVIKGCYCDSAGEEGIRLLNRLESGRIQGNEFGGTAGSRHLLARSRSDGTITNVQIVGNQFSQQDTADEFVRLVDAEECVVSENTFTAQSSVNLYVDGPNSTSNRITDNTYYSPKPPADLIIEDSGSIATGNTVYDTSPGS